MIEVRNVSSRGSPDESEEKGRGATSTWLILTLRYDMESVFRLLEDSG